MEISKKSREYRVQCRPREMMKTYTFRVVVEPDEDRWFACCPILEKRGAATWGYTHKEALKNIREVLQMVVEETIKDGEKIPFNNS